nr:hormone-sensitive lipase-like [Anolis sagrei ordinatus]
MDARPLFQTLHALVEDNAAFFRESSSEVGQRFLAAFLAIREHARCLEPVLGHLATIYHLFDLDEETPANGYRSLAQTVRCCLAHIVHKSRYVAANRRSLFFRTGHNCAELEAYCVALTQLRALVYLAQRLLTQNRPGSLFNHEERGLSQLFLREYTAMQKGCFYGRCMGFQVRVHGRRLGPSLWPSDGLSPLWLKRLPFGPSEQQPMRLTPAHKSGLRVNEKQKRKRKN